MPFAFAGPASLVTGVPYAESISGVAAALSGIVDDYYAILGVLATVLVALAAATNLGIAERMLGDRARLIVLRCVVICVFLIAGLSASQIFTAIMQPSRAVDALVGAVVAWVCVLVAQTVTGAANAGERARTARKNWRLRRDRAADCGVRRGQTVQVRPQVIAEAVLWVGPLMLWAAIAGFLTVSIDVPEVTRGTLILIAMLLYYGNVVFTLGWRATADLSDTARSRSWMRWFTGIGGMLVSVVLGLQMAMVSPALGWTLILFSATHLWFLMAMFSRAKPGAVIQRAATIRSLRRARANSDLRKRLAKNEARELMSEQQR
ncbi:hypothetical protein [Microbacterium sp. NPDC057944]|uniref:hypothetical protein n=1 Tax=Microbacterium sp. NPDC057944 TaxID=3346286 RepID=UPI0036DE4276